MSNQTSECLSSITRLHPLHRSQKSLITLVTTPHLRTCPQICLSNYTLAPCRPAATASPPSSAKINAAASAHACIYIHIYILTLLAPSSYPPEPAPGGPYCWLGGRYWLEPALPPPKLEPGPPENCPPGRLPPPGRDGPYSWSGGRYWLTGGSARTSGDAVRAASRIVDSASVWKVTSGGPWTLLNVWRVRWDWLGSKGIISILLPCSFSSRGAALH